MVIFLDTYAVIEIDKGNPNYRKYILDSPTVITTAFNIVEVYFYYLKNHNKNEAERVYNVVKKLLVPVDDSIIRRAGEFKLHNIKKRFSFADCIGYVTALNYGAKFLTGDYAFKGIENVEFVK